MTEQSPDPASEAIGELATLVREVNTSDIAAKHLLRRCIYIATLIGDAERVTYFGYQLNGFPPAVEMPDYRTLQGEVRWKSTYLSEIGDPHDAAGRAREMVVGVVDAPPLSTRLSVDDIAVRASGRGARSRNTEHARYDQALENGRNRYGTTYRHVEVEAWNYYSNDKWERVLRRIAEEAIEWATKTLVRLRYESRITTIWDSLRREVDSKLEEISLGTHLAAIDIQVGSDNEQMWRAALLACRNVLQDVADYLWETDAKEVLLPQYGTGNLVMMQCHLHQYVTRLKAYLRYKHVDDTELTLSMADADFLGNIVGRVNNYDNRGHATVSKEIAETGALYTYMVLSSLIRLTDMEPLTELPAGTFTS